MLLCSAGAAWAASADESDTDVKTLTASPEEALDAEGAAYATLDGVTVAGSVVENDAILGFFVGGVEQDDIAASGSGGNAIFTVDRLVDVNVTSPDGDETGAGQDAYVNFTVTNESNEDLDLLLRAELVDNTPSFAPGTPNIVAMCVDGDDTDAADGVCGTAGDFALPVAAGFDGNVYVLPAILPNETQDPGVPVNIVVQVDLGTSATGETGTYALAAQVSSVASDCSGACTPGSNASTMINEDSNGRVSPDVSATVDSGTSEADIAGGTAADIQDVFGEASGSYRFSFSDGSGLETSGVLRDGQHAADDTIAVVSADLVLTKTSEIIWDPIYGLKYEMVAVTDGVAATLRGAIPDTSTAVADEGPKAIPGAIVMYTITVQNDPENDDDAADATSVVVTDVLPADLDLGNVGTLTGLTDCPTGGSSGIAGSGRDCGTALDLENLLDQVLVYRCGTVSPLLDFPETTDSVDDFTAVSGTVTATLTATTPTVVSCTDSDTSAGDIGIVVFYQTIP